MKEMRKISLLLLTVVLTLGFNIQPVDASKITILSNGNVLPLTAPIDANIGDGIYTFTDSIYCDGIEVQKGNIIIDGDGFTLHGPGHDSGAYGFDIIRTSPVDDVNKVTIQNTYIENFECGIRLDGNTHNHKIRRNTIADCQTGVKLGGIESPLQFSANNEFYQNNFMYNCQQVGWDSLAGYSSAAHPNNVWDANYPHGGNYWSNYTGEDVNVDGGPNKDEDTKDGIGDEEYTIDANNIDHFPLVHPYMLSVRNIEKGTDYYTIQEAINDANPGDTIRASAGVYYQGRYYEQPYYEYEDPNVKSVDVNKSVWLIGEDKDTTIIDAIRNGGDVIKISANHTHVEGFRIQNAADANCAVDMNGVQFNHIIGNTIIGDTTKINTGIELYNGSNYNTLVDNDIRSNTEGGIDINDCNNVFVSKNTIKLNTNYGIVVEDSNDTHIVNNTLTSNKGGILIKGDSHYSEIRGNDISDPCAGIVVGTPLDINAPSDSNIASNMVTSDCNGIELYGTSDNIIFDNTVAGNGSYGLVLKNAPYNTIEDNVVEHYNNNGTGIYLDGDSNNVTIRGNEVSDSNDGIAIYNNHPDCDCNVIANVLTGNDNGIILTASGTNVTENIVAYNKCGIDVNGTNNWIYLNLFANDMNDGTNATACDAFNLWDNNEPNRAGNFWDDYYGTDANTPKDYIGDDPYSIGANNEDRAPLILVSDEFSTDPERPKMKRKYIVDLTLTNVTSNFFDPGFDANLAGLMQTDAYPGSWLDWSPGSGRSLPGWLDEDDLGKKNSYLDEVYVIPYDNNNTAQFAMPFTNSWDWIKPNDWKGVVCSLVCIYPGMPIGCSIGSFILACYDASKAVPCMTYVVEADNDGALPLIRFKRDATVYVPLEKLAALGTSVGLQVLSIKFAIIAAPLLSNPFTFAAGVAFTIKSAVCTIGSILAYYVAEDPDINYTDVFQPKSLSIGIPSDVNSIYLPADVEFSGVEERFALAALEMASLEQAYKKSYTRYDYATAVDFNTTTDCNDPNYYYMGLQLAAAVKYNDMATRKLEKLQFLTGVLITEMNISEISDDEIDFSRGVISRDWNDVEVRWADQNDPNAFIQIQKDVLEVFDFNDPDPDPNDPNRPNKNDVRGVMLYATDTTDANTEQMRERAYDPNNLYRYEHAMIEARYIQDYALQAALEETENLQEGFDAASANDVAIIDVWPSATEVCVGGKVAINVEVENRGSCAITSDVNVCVYVYADDISDANILGPQAVNDLAGQGNGRATLTFMWDTNDTNGKPVGPDEYTIKAVAETLGDEVFTFDNVRVGVSIEVWFVSGPPVPDAPTGLVCTGNTHNTVTLAWTPGGVTGYKVYRDGYYVGWSEDETCTDTGLIPCTTYTYTVSACDGASESGRSNEVSVTTNEKPDINNDCCVYFNDLVIIAGYWLDEYLEDLPADKRPDDVGDIHCNCDGSGCDGPDGFVDFYDFGIMAAHWRDGCDQFGY